MSALGGQGDPQGLRPRPCGDQRGLTGRRTLTTTAPRRRCRGAGSSATLILIIRASALPMPFAVVLAACEGEAAACALAGDAPPAEWPPHAGGARDRRADDLDQRRGGAAPFLDRGSHLPSEGRPSDLPAGGRRQGSGHRAAVRHGYGALDPRALAGAPQLRFLSVQRKMRVGCPRLWECRLPGALALRRARARFAPRRARGSEGAGHESTSFPNERTSCARRGGMLAI